MQNGALSLSFFFVVLWGGQSHSGLAPSPKLYSLKHLQGLETEGLRVKVSEAEVAVSWQLPLHGGQLLDQTLEGDSLLVCLLPTPTH